MNIYVEELTVRVCFRELIKFFFAAKISGDSLKGCFFFESTVRGELFARYFCWFIGIPIKRMSFKMKDIRDEHKELLRFRIYKSDLFWFQKRVLKSEAFRSVFQKNWDTNRALSFIKKGIVSGEISTKDAAARALYIIQVVYWHMNSSQITKSLLIFGPRPWEEVYCDYASSMGIKLINIKRKFKKERNRDFFQRKVRRITVAGKFFIKRIMKKNNRNNINQSHGNKNIQTFDSYYSQQASKITFFGKGDSNFNNNGFYSDLFFWIQSDLDKKNINCRVGHSINEGKAHLAEELGIEVIKSFSTKKYGIIEPIKESSILSLPKDNYLYNEEVEFFRDQLNQYNAIKKNWSLYFEKFNVKIYLTWFKYNNEHIAIGDAINEVGGVSAVWQMAFDGIPLIDCMTAQDIVFGFSNSDIKKELNQGSDISYYITTGYLQDYAPSKLNKIALELSNQIRSFGAKKIITVFDENSLDDDQWHTGHSLQEENYKLILQKVLETPWIGVIFKPKSPLTLRKRLGDVAQLLDEGVATGRCYVCEEAGDFRSNTPPILAGLASDVAIHGHFHAGTAALECALAGIPTLLINREGVRDSLLDQLGEGQVIFSDWGSALDALIDFFKRDGDSPKFGDWSEIISDLDPFRDGKAANRMGNYLKWLLDGFSDGLDRDIVLADAAERYCKKWGYDKISAVKNDFFI